MEKLKTLTQEQFNSFKNAEKQEVVVKKLLNIPNDIKIGIGDTATKIGNAKSLEVYKNTYKGREYFYIVIEPMNEEFAMCYSIYPC